MPSVDPSSFYTYKEAKKVAAYLKLKNYRDWCAYVSPFKEIEKGGKKLKVRKPPHERKDPKLPSDPRTFYMSHGKSWVSWGDFLGTGNLAPTACGYLSYKDAIKAVHALRISSQKEYRDFIVKNRIQHLPLSPYSFYTRRGESFSWKQFLHPRYISYEEAKQYMLGVKVVKSFQDWVDFCASGSKPKFIPSAPDKYYKEWVSWPDFLQSKNTRRIRKVS